MSTPPNLFLHVLVTPIKEFAKIESEHDLRLKVCDAFFGKYSVEGEWIYFLVYHEHDRLPQNIVTSVVMP